MRILFALALLAATAQAQSPETLDDSIPPGKNFLVAQFRFWAPPGNTPLRAMLVLVPGSNGDGRSMAKDTVWQQFATKHNLGIIACRFTDKPDNPERAFESYVAVSKGSGDALQAALTHFADRTERWEVANIPFLMWGMSAGGQFNYEYVAWKPDRVAGFVVNKGGVYYSALLSRESRRVPGILFTGGKDLEFRTNTINGLFNVNRRGGALWALAEEPSAAHVVGRSRDVAMAFYEDIIPLRLANPGQPLKALEEKSGFLGDFKTKSFAPQGDKPTPGTPFAWLPTERVAKMWEWLVTERPTP